MERVRATSARWPLLAALGSVFCGALAVEGLVIEQPCCSVLTHVSGEFTNMTVMEESLISAVEVVTVTPFNACDAIAMDLSGKVALVQRGECNFVQKVWNAQRANATAVIVIDSHLREDAPYHIIMQKDDEYYTNIHIPSVFLAYSDGETLLYAMRKALPWNPVLVTLNEHGELPPNKPTYRLLKRIVAYVFLVSVVCVFSSGFSLLSSAIFAWIGSTRRTRAAKKLPVMKYTRHLQQRLLTQLAVEHTVMETIHLSDAEETEPAESTCSHSCDPFTAPRSEDGDASEAEMCSICLDDFEANVDVKVLPCQHFYHVECIDPWIEFQSGSCPLCKQDAIAIVDGLPKYFMGITIPRVDQILQQEHLFHTFFLMLPASLVSCLIVNSAASIIGSVWP